jgi:hypothetical protein
MQTDKLVDVPLTSKALKNAKALADKLALSITIWPSSHLASAGSSSGRKVLSSTNMNEISKAMVIIGTAMNTRIPGAGHDDNRKIQPHMASELDSRLFKAVVMDRKTSRTQ